ncbi:MAG: putative thioesterase [Rhizobacter sp.]|nr:putative thioesterase [Rhizobacter sp.]
MNDAILGPSRSGGAIDRAEIERRLPHAGAMCLIDRVDRWQADSIVCHASAPGQGHPLASISTTSQGSPEGRPTVLHSVATVEYAAQAVALHVSLIDGAPTPRSGLLAKLSKVTLSSRPVSGAMTIEARLLTRSDAGCLHAFDVRDMQGTCASGRLMIAFDS